MAQSKPQYSRTFIGTFIFETEVGACEASKLFCPVSKGKTVFFNDPLFSDGPNGQVILTISGEYVVHGNVPHDFLRFQTTAFQGIERYNILNKHEPITIIHAEWQYQTKPTLKPCGDPQCIPCQTGKVIRRNRADKLLCQEVDDGTAILQISGPTL